MKAKLACNILIFYPPTGIWRKLTNIVLQDIQVFTAPKGWPIAEPVLLTILKTQGSIQTTKLEQCYETWIWCTASSNFFFFQDSGHKESQRARIEDAVFVTFTSGFSALYLKVPRFLILALRVAQSWKKITTACCPLWLLESLGRTI